MTRPVGMAQTSRWSAVLGLAALVSTAGCRGGLDDPCRCASDCRAGLVCSADGQKILEPNVCYDSGVNGVCVQAEEQDSDSGPAVVTEAPVYMDMASRRDFQPAGSVSESLSDATTDATDGTMTGMSATGTTTDTTTGSTGSTGDTDTSTGSTGTTGSTTDTSSTGTTTDTTGSTTDTTGSTGSTGSTSDSSSGSSGSSSTT